MIPKPLVGPRLMICEGPNDRAVFDALLDARAIAGFEIAYPSKAETQTGGRNGFADLLVALKLQRGISNIQRLILVSDSDANPANSFRAVTSQIQTAGDYGVPPSELHFVPSLSGLPEVAVFMIPDTNTPGQLEDLCLQAAYRRRSDLQPPLNTYCTAVVQSSWSANRESKMRLRVLMASHYHKPNVGLRQAWNARPGPLIPLNDPCFDRLVNFLLSVP